MNVISKKISEIKTYENNPRRNDGAVDYVVNSIEEFGFRVPIVIDRSGVIVCGHTRYKAAKKLKLAEVPCIVADDLTEEQIRAFRLADNRVAAFSEWDDAKLREEIGEITSIDLSEFGFKKDKIEGIFRDKAEAKVHVCPKCGHEWSES